MKKDMEANLAAITKPSGSRFVALLNGIFPRMPDFYGLLNQQSKLVVTAMDVFVAFMETGDAAMAKEIRRLEHQGDKLKARNIDVLNRAFSTPFDREDIYRAATAIDEGLNYAKTTVREMEILRVEPDAHMVEMARLLHQGASALHAGFANLKSSPLAAERDAAAVRKSERLAEKVYRKAIAELFDPEHFLQKLAVQRREASDELTQLLEPMDQQGCVAVGRGLSFVMEALKRREVYRHLSNASDHLARAGEILHDIVVKTT